MFCQSCGKIRHGCPFCGNTLSSFSNLKKHVENVHQEDFRICPFCRKSKEDNVEICLKHVGSHFVGSLKPINIMEDEEEEEEEEEFFDQDEYFIHKVDSCVEVDNMLTRSEKNENEIERSMLNNVEEKKNETLQEIEERYIFKEDVDFFDGIMIEPIQQCSGFGPFNDEHNYRLARFAQKYRLSEEALKELIHDLKESYESPKEFFSAETLKRKMGEMNKEGISLSQLECCDGHKIPFLPITESLKLLFSKDDVLENLHFCFKNNDGGSIHFSQSEQFRRCQQIANANGCLPIVAVSNRDDFPGFIFSECSIKGYYFALANLSYPYILRNVCCFSVGLNCENCKRILEEEFVKNCNELNQRFFLVYHSFLQKWIKCQFFLCSEVDDSPEAAYMKMTKKSGAICGCHDCKIDSCEYVDMDVSSEKKSLLDSEQKYNECRKLLANGETKKIEKIERSNGYSFMESSSSNRKRKFFLKAPSSFFHLNRCMKELILLPPDPFHSVKKNFVLHVIKGIEEKLTPLERQKVDDEWSSIEFPKGLRCPKSVWNLVLLF